MVVVREITWLVASILRQTNDKVVNGVCQVVNGVSQVVNGVCQVVNGVCQVVNGVCQVIHINGSRLSDCSTTTASNRSSYHLVLNNEYHETLLGLLTRYKLLCYEAPLI